MLSGHWPYYTGLQGQASDNFLFLNARLMEEPDLSLVEQDLQFLSIVSKLFRLFVYFLRRFWTEPDRSRTDFDKR